MTTFQRLVLERLSFPLAFAGGWVFRRDIRADRRLASAIYWAFVREMD